MITPSEASSTAKRPAGSDVATAMQPAPLTTHSDWERAALEVCRRLTEGELSIKDLGRTPGTEGYVLLRDVAPSWLKKDDHKNLARTWIDGADVNLVLLAHICAWEIDGGDLAHAGAGRGEESYKVLFSDRADKHFFSAGVEDGHLIGDSANQFREFLASRHSPESLAKAMKASPLKFLEDELVDFAGLPEESLA